MLTPVKTRPDADILDFVWFKSEAEAVLGGRVAHVPVYWRTRFDTPEAAYDAAKQTSRRWIDWLETNRPKIKEPRPTYVSVASAPGGGWCLRSHIFTFAKDRPLARSVTEALEHPLEHLPALDSDSIQWRDQTAVRVTKDLPPYARKSTVERKYASQLQCGAASIVQDVDGRFRARLTYWRLPPIALARDRLQVEEGQNYDLLYHAKDGDRFTQDVGPTGLPEEGSGRPMGY